MLSLCNPSGITPYHPRPRPPSHRMPPGQLPLKRVTDVWCKLSYYAISALSGCPLSGNRFGQHFVADFSRLIQSKVTRAYCLRSGHSYWDVGFHQVAWWRRVSNKQTDGRNSHYILCSSKGVWILPWAGKTPCGIIMSYRLRLKALLSHAQMLGRFK